jgi:hypothetical protein
MLRANPRAITSASEEKVIKRRVKSSRGCTETKARCQKAVRALPPPVRPRCPRRASPGCARYLRTCSGVHVQRAMPTRQRILLVSLPRPVPLLSPVWFAERID